MYKNGLELMTVKNLQQYYDKVNFIILMKKGKGRTSKKFKISILKFKTNTIKIHIRNNGYYFYKSKQVYF